MHKNNPCNDNNNDLKNTLCYPGFFFKNYIPNVVRVLVGFWQIFFNMSKLNTRYSEVRNLFCRLTLHNCLSTKVKIALLCSDNNKAAGATVMALPWFYCRQMQQNTFWSVSGNIICSYSTVLHSADGQWKMPQEQVRQLQSRPGWASPGMKPSVWSWLMHSRLKAVIDDKGFATKTIFSDTVTLLDVPIK